MFPVGDVVEALVDENVVKPDLNRIQVIEEFISDEVAAKILAEEVTEIPSRKTTLKRAPKQEYGRDANSIWYYYQQHKTALERQKLMPDWMLLVGYSLAQFGMPSFNHSIIIRMSDGVKHHAPPHRDNSEDIGGKTGCMKRGSGFGVISVGEPRTFQFMDKDGNVVWERKLPHRSFMYVPAEFNAAYWHCVPKDPQHTGVRCSLIFRDILIQADSAPKRRKVQEVVEEKVAEEVVMKDESNTDSADDIEREREAEWYRLPWNLVGR